MGKSSSATITTSLPATGRHALVSELDAAELPGFAAGFGFKSAMEHFRFAAAFRRYGDSRTG
jgi:hypothetical protein